VGEIPPFRLVPEPLNDEAAALPGFKSAGPGPGTRHQLGGTPRAIQPLEYPRCSQCREAMTFYGQLDSINDDFCIADVGLIYVFFCFECIEAATMIDSY
jgi:hypothetical protein